MCHLRDIDATVWLDGVHRAHGDTAVQGASADVVLTTQTFTGLLGNAGTATLTPDPAAGDLRIRMGPGGIVQVAEKPQLHGRVIEFTATGVRLMGRPVPPAMQGKITGMLTVKRQLTRLPLGLAPSSVAVTGDGIKIHLTGRPP